MQPKRKEALVLWIHTSLQASSPYLPTSPQRKPNRVFFFSRQNKTELFRGSQIQIVDVKPTVFVSLWNKEELLWEIQWERTWVSPHWPEIQGQTSRPHSDLPTPLQCPHHLQHNSIKVPNYKSARRKRKLQSQGKKNPCVWISVTVETVFHVHTYTYYTAGQPGVTHRCTGWASYYCDQGRSVPDKTSAPTTINRAQICIDLKLRVRAFPSFIISSPVPWL